MDLNNINTINENNNNESEKGNNNQNDENDLTNSKNSIVRQEEISYEADKENRIDDDFHLGENIIESDEENIKAKRITIEENKNIYFNFLKDGLINDCQVRKGKFGEFTACSNYPTCKYIKKEQKEIKEIVKCPECGGMIIEKKSKRGKVFYGCNNYPKCKVATWDIPTGEKCPECGKPLVEKNNTIKCSECDYTKE